MGYAHRTAKASAAVAAQETITAARGGYELVHIPSGVFWMGSPETDGLAFSDERPQHEVRVADFYLGRYPVTNEEYARFLADNAGAPEPGYWGDRRFNQPRQPVVGVSWEEAKRYAEWAGLRLSSEAEWEYACRAGTATRYHAGDKEADLDRVGWYDHNAGGRTHPVGEKEPNGWGLYDMHGNVWEWCEDDRHDDYRGAPADGSAWVDEPRVDVRVIRGGSFGYSARFARSAYRSRYGPASRWRSSGFRLARS